MLHINYLTNVRQCKIRMLFGLNASNREIILFDKLIHYWWLKIGTMCSLYLQIAHYPVIELTDRSSMRNKGRNIYLRHQVDV
jgi:hypothetical protein